VQDHSVDAQGEAEANVCYGAGVGVIAIDEGPGETVEEVLGVQEGAVGGHHAAAGPVIVLGPEVVEIDGDDLLVGGPAAVVETLMDEAGGDALVRSDFEDGPSEFRGEAGEDGAFFEGDGGGEGVAGLGVEGAGEAVVLGDETGTESVDEIVGKKVDHLAPGKEAPRPQRTGGGLLGSVEIRRRSERGRSRRCRLACCGR